VSDATVDITIVGAGPTGLSAAFWAGMRQASCRIIDSLPEIGGQCTALYPEKWIYDVPGHPRILAGELVARLREQIEPFAVPIHLETMAERLEYDGEEIVLHTDDGELRSRTVIVAGGHGAVEPKRLPATDADLDPWEGLGVRYLVGDKQELAGRRVAVVGGGDSALDWVLNLLDTAAEVTLVHRRDRYRAHEATVAEVMAHVDAGRVGLRAPCTIAGVEGDGRVEALLLNHREAGFVERLECDAVLLQLGFASRLGPLRDWGFDIERNALKVDPLMQTSLDRVWACGDVATADGKLALIAMGFAEAATAVSQALLRVRPGMTLQPAYSTDTGVPGMAVR